MKLVECVPNFSEGRRPEVVKAIVDAMAAVDGTLVLDVSSDASHNRTVVTFVVPADRAVDAAFAGMKEAAARIDLTTHQGEHPRMGATDVVPFIPLEGRDDGGLRRPRARARRARREASSGFPIFLYEKAASTPKRENLADVRRGEFEGLRDEIPTNPERIPDFGPRHVHATAGATAVGARPFLVAYNVYLGDAKNVPVAKEVAKAVRGSSGGLRYVKGLGLEVDGQAQVSMNLVDMDKTPMHRAYDVVKLEAAARGVATTWSEIVGLVPEKALFDAAARYLQLTNFSMDQVLERRVRERDRGRPEPLRLRRLGRLLGARPRRRQRRRPRRRPRRRARADGRGAHGGAEEVRRGGGEVQGDRTDGLGARRSALGAGGARCEGLCLRVGGLQAPEGHAGAERHARRRDHRRAHRRERGPTRDRARLRRASRLSPRRPRRVATPTP